MGVGKSTYSIKDAHTFKCCAYRVAMHKKGTQMKNTGKHY